MLAAALGSNTSVAGATLSLPNSAHSSIVTVEGPLAKPGWLGRYHGRFFRLSTCLEYWANEECTGNRKGVFFLENITHCESKAEKVPRRRRSGVCVAAPAGSQCRALRNCILLL